MAIMIAGIWIPLWLPFTFTLVQRGDLAYLPLVASLALITAEGTYRSLKPLNLVRWKEELSERRYWFYRETSLLLFSLVILWFTR